MLYDLGRRQHMSHEEPLRIFRIAYADVAVGIHDIFLGEDPVGNDKFVEGFFQSDHHRSPGALYRKDLLFFLFGDFFQFMDVIVCNLLNFGEGLLLVIL